MICWECGTPLIDNGEGEIFETWIDEIGNEHKLHKICFKHMEKRLTADHNEWEGERKLPK